MDERRRWSDLWARASLSGDPGPALERLLQAYAEPHRAYHTLGHIQSCLAEFDPARGLAVHPDEVELALWFHDLVYDPRAADNESRSADRAAQALGEAGLGRASLDRLHSLILATRHADAPPHSDARLIADVDLAIFGSPEAVFDRYEAQIRVEYGHVPEAAFRQGRASILESFLSRRTIFQTDFYRARYEAPARANLARSIRQLRA